jgi:hypothetical protein
MSGEHSENNPDWWVDHDELTDEELTELRQKSEEYWAQPEVQARVEQIKREIATGVQRLDIEREKLLELFQITPEQVAFKKRLEERLQTDFPHLYEKWKSQLNGPYMQTALWTIMEAADARRRAETAREQIRVYYPHL